MIQRKRERVSERKAGRGRIKGRKKRNNLTAHNRGNIK
jgi:hypothetical protein